MIRALFNVNGIINFRRCQRWYIMRCGARRGDLYTYGLHYTYNVYMYYRGDDIIQNIGCEWMYCCSINKKEHALLLRPMRFAQPSHHPREDNAESRTGAIKTTPQDNTLRKTTYLLHPIVAVGPCRVAMRSSESERSVIDTVHVTHVFVLLLNLS